MKIVLAFGTFDGLHDGHRSMLAQAKKLGDKLVVAVPKDSNVERIKGATPAHTESIRQMMIRAENIADKVIEADSDMNSWQVLGKVDPDIVAIGYDQIEMEKSLRNFIKEHNLNIEIVVLESYKAETMHNSLLKTK